MIPDLPRAVLANVRGPVPEEPYAISLGRAAVKREVLGAAEPAVPAPGIRR